MSESSGAPPLRPSGLVLRRDMTFWHDGVQVTHPKLYRAFLRGVEFAEEEGIFVVRVGQFRGQIEVEDTPYWVVAYDPEPGNLTLTDETEEPLRPETLSIDPDEVVRCTVKGRFPARFTREGQSELLESLDLEGAEPAVRIGERWVAAPGFSSALGRG
ncbi:MAG: hypothetical protein V3V67_03885 [Myxococcota bacterium]